MSNFKVLATDGSARVGELKTAHGVIKTPVFMPVGTQATVKSLSPDDLKNVGAQVILGNTYHLYLRPGSKLIKKMGGLHAFCGWDGPILTDSGGFQAFSLGAMIRDGVRKSGKLITKSGEQRSSKSKNYKQSLKFNPLVEDNKGLNYGVKQKNYSIAKLYQTSTVKSRIFTKIEENGVRFKSHLDGSEHLLTPEKSIEVQLDLGSDIVLTLDELVSPLSPLSYIQESLERTHNWETRSKDYFKKNIKKGTNPKAQLFGILQGVDDFDIRTAEARWIAEQGFDGISIGGSFGTTNFDNEYNADWSEKAHAIDKTMSWITPLLPANLPRHALGIGEVADFFLCIEQGVDMFDCVAPTRRARNGSLYISPKNGGNKLNKFTLNISNAKFFDDKNPIDPGCECYTCQNFTRAYLKHLYTASELLYHRLATIHNVYFMLHLVDTIRESIMNKQFLKLKDQWLT